MELAGVLRASCLFCYVDMLDESDFAAVVLDDVVSA
jgi:hypothetical protein